MENYFSMQFTPAEVNQITNLGLAHVGDGVYELLCRTYLCANGDKTALKLHRDTVNMVKAAAQAKAAARYSGGSGKKKEPTVSAEEKAAQSFVDNMLQNATSSRFDPERVINSTNQLTSSQKKIAQKYLTEVLNSGAMK